MQPTHERPERGRPSTGNLYSDTEESDADLPLLYRRANLTFPQDRHPEDTLLQDHPANATFPGSDCGPRGLRRTNAFHSRVPRSIRHFDHTDQITSSQEDDDRPDPPGAARWEEGRSADRTDTTEHSRESRRYHPYHRDPNRTGARSQPPPGRRRSEHRHSTSRSRRSTSNSTEKDGHTLYDSESALNKATPYLPTNDPQALHIMLQNYVKSLPEPQRKAFFQGITPGKDEPDTVLQTESVSAGPIKVVGAGVVGLRTPPGDLSETDDLVVDEVDFEQIEEVLSQLTNVVNNSKIRADDEMIAVMDWLQPLLDKFNGSTISAWHDSETLLHETIIKITTSAHSKAVELKEKALVELDKIDAAEQEKLRLIEVAREDFKKILSDQQAELGLLEASFEEKTKALRRKAEKLLTPGQISEEALESVRDRRSSKAKGRR